MQKNNYHFQTKYLSVSMLEISDNLEANRINNRTNQLQFIIKSSCPGWVAVGLNTKNDIVGANLFMMKTAKGSSQVAGSLANIEHHFVTTAGVHPKVEELGRKNKITKYRASSNPRGNGGKHVTHELHVNGISESKYIILACSMENDFNHHSIERRHFQIKRAG